MAVQQFSVNTDSVIALTAKLERINRSAFPMAVRSTLNDGAFAMKQGNILASAERNMTVRNKTFFKKFTGVNKATGYDVKSMYSEVGFINTDPDKLKGQKAMEGMEHNEVGGSDNTGAMYMKKTRISSSARKLVRRNARFAKSNVAKGTSSSIKGKKLAFMSNVLASLREGKPTFIKSSKGTFFVQVKQISSGFKGKRKGKLDIKMDFFMRSRRQHIAHAKATHFNKKAAEVTAKEMEGFYAKNAERQFARVWK